MEELFVYRVAGNVDPQAVKFPDIEGLQELWTAMQDQVRYLALRKEYEEGFIQERPQKPTSSVADLRQQYPRADAYIRAMIWAGSSHFKKAAFGKQAMERIAAGENYIKAITDMQTAWAAFNLAQQEG